MKYKYFNLPFGEKRVKSGKNVMYPLRKNVKQLVYLQIVVKGKTNSVI